MRGEGGGEEGEGVANPSQHHAQGAGKIPDQA